MYALIRNDIGVCTSTFTRFLSDFRAGNALSEQLPMRKHVSRCRPNCSFNSGKITKLFAKKRCKVCAHDFTHSLAT